MTGRYRDTLLPQLPEPLKTPCFAVEQCFDTYAGCYRTGNALYTSVRAKYYGDKLAEVMICSEPIFKAFDGDSKPAKRRRTKENENDPDECLESDDSADNLDRSRRRARKAVFDLTMCNPDLDTFITLTLSPDKIDRTDYTAIIKKLNTWLDNRVRRHGLKYVIVAEYHKDGQAIHFHGLINSTAVKLDDSGKTDKRGHTIYNLPEWRLGFTTAMSVYGDDNRGSCCKYICKYIGKSNDKVGGRWYYSGGDLSRPTYEYLPTSAMMEKQLQAMPDMDMFEFTPEGLDRKFTIYRNKWR